MATPSKDDMTVRVGSESLAPTVGTVAEAAYAAAEAFAPDEIEKHAQAIADAWASKLTLQSKTHTKQLAAMTRGSVRPQAAEPINSIVPYQWWNLILAGPFQSIVPAGPFLPRKIINSTEACFFLVALWRNPAPSPGGGPSAANVMSAYNYRVWLQASDITTMAAGPNTVLPAPPVPPFTFGGGFINIHTRVFPAGTFTGAVQGRPELFEMNALVDILGPGPGLPAFAGYSTWVLDPDSELPFAFPFIPGVGPVFVPGQGPQLQHDIPARFMIYV